MHSPWSRYEERNPEILENLLDIRNLVVQFDSFEGRLQVLNGISLQVRSGERVGLVGETGCGKSVTMKTALGILPIPPGRIVKGEIWVRGKNVLEMRAKERDRIVKGFTMSYVPQDPNTSLNPVFTIERQMTYVVKYNAMKTGKHLSKEKIKARIFDIFHSVQLPDPKTILHNYPCQLSGGMCQRVLIAMALVTQPSLLIMDEPGTALDVTIQEQILQLLNQLVNDSGVSLLVITHDLGVIRELTETVYTMYAGTVVESGPTKDILENPKHPYTLGLIASVPKLTGEGIYQGIKGRVPDYLAPPRGCRFHPRCDSAMDICRQSKPNMTDLGDERKVWCYLFGGRCAE